MKSFFHYDIKIEKIKLPSEGNENPMDDIRFYRKPKGGKTHILSKDEVREMVKHNNILIIAYHNIIMVYILERHPY